MIVFRQPMHAVIGTETRETNWFKYDCPYKLLSHLRDSVEFAARVLLDGPPVGSSGQGCSRAACQSPVGLHYHLWL